MSESIPPVIVKHHIFERLEELSRDWEKVSSMRERLERGASAEQIVERLVANGVCDEKLGRLLLHWIGGDRFEGIRARCVEIARHIGKDGPYLSAWWVLGISKSVRVEHLVLDDRIVLLLLTPHLDLDEVIAKARAGIDPTGPRLLAAYEGAIGGVLAELPGRSPRR